MHCGKSPASLYDVERDKRKPILYDKYKDPNTNFKNCFKVIPKGLTIVLLNGNNDTEIIPENIFKYSTSLRDPNSKNVYIQIGGSGSETKLARYLMQAKNMDELTALGR